MKLRSCLLVHFMASLSAAFAIPPRDYENRQYFIVEIDHSVSGENLHSFIEQHDREYRYEHPVRGLDDHFVFSVDKNHEHVKFLGNHNSDPHNLMRRAARLEEAFDKIVSHPGLMSVHMLHPKKLEKRMPVPVDHAMKLEEDKAFKTEPSDKVQKEVRDKLGINDPLFTRQWHLVNTRHPDQDLNVKNLWYGGIRGQNITVAVIDDGLDHDSDDLKDNFSAEGSWDFNANQNLPTPKLFDDHHGTRCAGEIAAVKNDACGIGVAYEANIAGIRILSGKITSAEEAAAMIYGLDVNDIYSCSWGPSDLGYTVAGPDLVVRKAAVKGVQEGRSGRGAIYVFASGNGAGYQDQCNFDGYTNSIYSITVGAIDFKGLHPYYAETCSAVMVVTYSSGSGEHIQTTDIRKQCSSGHGGTSAAAPLAAGVYALALQANPNLTWRDLQHINARSAVTVNETDGDYQETALGLKYSHKYGYGKIDAEKLVEAAKTWINVKPQAWYYSDVVEVEETIKSSESSASDWITNRITVTKEDLDVTNFERLEHVTITVNIESTIRGLILARLTSPHGVVSTLAQRRSFDKSGLGLSNWTFMSVAHWGEDGLGDWTLEVSSAIGQNEITLKNWQLRLFGESIEAEKAEKFDVTKDYAAVRGELLESRPTLPPEGETMTTIAPVSPSVGPETETKTSSAKSSTPSAFEEHEDPDSDESSNDSDKEDDESISDHSHKKKEDRTRRYFLALAIFTSICALIAITWRKLTVTSPRSRSENYEFELITEQTTDDESGYLNPSHDTETLSDMDSATLPEYDMPLIPGKDEETY